MPVQLSPQDRDQVIRTIMGEARHEPAIGQAAIAHVIFNRLASGKYGNTATKVVHAPGQFEPWFRRKAELNQYNPNSADYQKVGQIVDASASGAIPDPTGGMTFFLEPGTVQKRVQSGKMNWPGWATGQGLQIGRHVFYPPEGSPQRVLGAQQAISSAMGFLGKGQGQNAPMAFAGTPGAIPVAGSPADAAQPAQEPWSGTLDRLESEAKKPANQASPTVAEPWSGILNRLDKEEKPATFAERFPTEPALKQQLGPPQSIGEKIAASPWTGTEFLTKARAGIQGGAVPSILGRAGIDLLKGTGDLGESIMQGIGSLLQPVADQVGHGKEFAKERKAYEQRVAKISDAYSEQSGLSGDIVRMIPALAPLIYTKGRLTSPATEAAISRVAGPLGTAALRTTEAAGAGGLTAALTSAKSEKPLTQQVKEGALTSALFPAGGKAISMLTHSMPPFAHAALGAGAATVLGPLLGERYSQDPEALWHDLQTAGAATAAGAAGKAGFRWPAIVGGAAGQTNLFDTAKGILGIVPQ